MAHWLKMIGASDWPLGQFPLKDRSEIRTAVRFPRDRFPGRLINPGDLLVYYAVGGWKRVFAIVEMAGAVKRDVPSGDPRVNKRWPHAAPVRPDAVLRGGSRTSANGEFNQPEPSGSNRPRRLSPTDGRSGVRESNELTS